MKVLFCLDRDQSSVWAAQPLEISAYLKLFDVVVIESQREDITESSTIKGSIVHCLPDNPALTVLTGLGYTFKAGDSKSVNNSSVAWRGTAEDLIRLLRRQPKLQMELVFMVGYNDLKMST